MEYNGRKTRAAGISVISNTALVVIKLITGLLIGSVSIISEAIHSGVDLIAAIIALYSVKTSSLPADSEHPFGHGKIENISGTVEALLIFVAAIWIIVEAIKKLLYPEPIEAVGWGVGIMLVSAITNIFVSQMLFKVGKETDSLALQADAWHLRTDVYTSAGVMAGLALLWIAEGFPLENYNFFWLDPVAALIVAILIIKAAYNLTSQSAKDLLDVHLPSVELGWIRERIREQSRINGFHDLRTRKAGHFRFIEFHLKFEPYMSVIDSHAFAKNISNNIKAQFPNTTITIHIEPCDGKCVDKCIGGCFLTEQKRKEKSEYPNIEQRLII